MSPACESFPSSPYSVADIAAVTAELHLDDLVDASAERTAATPAPAQLVPQPHQNGVGEGDGRASVRTILTVTVAIVTLVGWRPDNADGGVRLRLRSRSKLSEKNNHLGRFFMFDLIDPADSSDDVQADGVEQMRVELAALIAALTASLGLHDGILVMALVLIERMMRLGFPLNAFTLRPVVLTAILIASKEGYDEARFPARPDARAHRRSSCGGRRPGYF